MEDNRHLLLELAAIVHRRNEINDRRRRAMWKVNYYKNIKETIYAWQGTSPALVKAENRLLFSSKMFPAKDIKDVLKKEVDLIRSRLEWRKGSTAKPEKWIKRGFKELNRVIMKHRHEYVKARYEMMCHTKKTHKRVIKLLKQLNARLRFDNGSVEAIIVKTSIFSSDVVASKDNFQRLADEQLANKAIEKILGE